jgi:hypothetical protein
MGAKLNAQSALLGLDVALVPNMVQRMYAYELLLF